MTLDRRHLLAILGTGAIAARRAFAQPSLQAIDERLTQAQQDGRVSDLHALLVSRGSKRVSAKSAQGRATIRRRCREVTLHHGIVTCARNRATYTRP
jgi:hypothetical protein